MSSEKLSAASTDAVARSIENILTATFGDLAAHHGRAPASDRTRLDQIQNAAVPRLRDPNLTIAELATQLHLSVSSIHRAFDGASDTPAAWIWTQRLEAVRKELGDPQHSHRTISDLATEWGFVDAAHFSRTFKARFGCTPRAYRLAAQQP